MATFTTELQDKKKDGTYNVKLRITHNRQIRRISTHIYVTDDDLTPSKKIKNPVVLNQCDMLVIQCRTFCNELGFGVTAMPIEELKVRLIEELQGGKHFTLDFIQYAEKIIKGIKKGTAVNYRSTINALKRYIRGESLDIFEITSDFLAGFKKFLETEPSMRGINRKGKRREAKMKGGRAVSLYLSVIRAIHNRAKKEFNKEDRGIIRIPYSPFKNFEIPPEPPTKKRALPVETIQKIIDIPYRKERQGARLNRFNLAKDCFILSFALIGMNSVDMYLTSAPKEDVFVYNRAKTESRRDDRAEMHVKVEKVISDLIKKYRDLSGARLFMFYRYYTNPQNFNHAINKGLKMVAEEIGVAPFDFYAARHTWATVARSAAVGIDKATVHEALNHVDDRMRVTDIYIDRDWSVIWNANKKVLDLFDWTELDLMYLL